MSELIERLEARRRWMSNGERLITGNEVVALLDLAIAAEQRHQAEEYCKSVEWLELPVDEAMAWLDATQPTRVNAALDALTQHLLGSTTTTEDGTA